MAGSSVAITAVTCLVICFLPRLYWFQLPLEEHIYLGSIPY